jgi:23S rRNA (pseudouridine1915-N3)-methyltransferase
VLNIDILCVGRLKEKYFKEACAEYEKRIGAWARIKIFEIDEEKLPEKPSPAQVQAALEKEADRILAKLGGFVFALCVEGEKQSSEELAQSLSKLMAAGRGTVCLVIGGSFGLSGRVKERADSRLSLSDMTFPHQLARVMALEQLYRALSIIHKGKYHK